MPKTPEEIKAHKKAYLKIYYETHKQEILAYRKEYYHANPEKFKTPEKYAANKRWADANKDYHKAYRIKWLETNREKWNEYNRQYVANRKERQNGKT